MQVVWWGSVQLRFSHVRDHHATGLEASLSEVLATHADWEGLVSKLREPSERIKHGAVEG